MQSISNHELAKKYELKLKALGLEDTFVYELIDNDEVELQAVKKYNVTGRLVIPSFITTATKTIGMWSEFNAPLRWCEFTEIYVENRPDRTFDAAGLCMNMHSKEIKIEFRYPNKVKHIDRMFEECRLAEKISVENFNNSKGIELHSVFNGCSSLKEIKFSSKQPGTISSMLRSFNNCYRLKKIDLRGLDLSKVEYMDEIVSGCKELEKIYIGKTEDNVVNSIKGQINKYLGREDVEVIVV